MTKSELLKDAKPILFNTEMVRAILDGRKTQTRRIIKNLPENTYRISQVDENLWEAVYDVSGYGICIDLCEELKPPYQIGEAVYVRETWNFLPFQKTYIYKADDPTDDFIKHGEIGHIKWHPSIHMQKEAARIFLRVTDVKAERLQDITEEQAKAEGANYKNGKNAGFEEKMRRSAIERFMEIWDSTIKKSDLVRYGWRANPWVWVVEFERLEAGTKC